MLKNDSSFKRKNAVINLTVSSPLCITEYMNLVTLLHIYELRLHQSLYLTTICTNSINELMCNIVN